MSTKIKSGGLIILTFLNSDLAVTTGTATAWAGTITQNNCKKYGKLCVCDVRAYKSTSTLIANESLFALPWAPDINDTISFVSVARNTTNGSTKPMTAYLSPESAYRTVASAETDSNFNELRCHIVYMTSE